MSPRFLFERFATLLDEQLRVCEDIALNIAFGAPPVGVVNQQLRLARSWDDANKIYNGVPAGVVVAELEPFEGYNVSPDAALLAVIRGRVSELEGIVEITPQSVTPLRIDTDTCIEVEAAPLPVPVKLLDVPKDLIVAARSALPAPYCREFDEELMVWGDRVGMLYLAAYVFASIASHMPTTFRGSAVSSRVLRGMVEVLLEEDNKAILPPMERLSETLWWRFARIDAQDPPDVDIDVANRDEAVEIAREALKGFGVYLSPAAQIEKVTEATAQRAIASHFGAKVRNSAVARKFLREIGFAFDLSGLIGKPLRLKSHPSGLIPTSQPIEVPLATKGDYKLDILSSVVLSRITKTVYSETVVIPSLHLVPHIRNHPRVPDNDNPLTLSISDTMHLLANARPGVRTGFLFQEELAKSLVEEGLDRATAIRKAKDEGGYLFNLAHALAYACVVHTCATNIDEADYLKALTEITTARVEDYATIFAAMQELTIRKVAFDKLTAAIEGYRNSGCNLADWRMMEIKRFGHEVIIPCAAALIAPYYPLVFGVMGKNDTVFGVLFSRHHCRKQQSFATHSLQGGWRSKWTKPLHKSRIVSVIEQLAESVREIK